MNNIISKDNFVQDVQRWVWIDNKMKLINEKAKELRTHKSTIASNITTYMQDNDLLENKIKISDGELRIFEKKEYTGLTFGYLEKCLGELIADKSQVEYIIKYLKDKREMNIVYELKRTYIDT